MTTLCMVKSPPPRLHFRVDIDGRGSDSEEELLDFVRANSRGAVYWMKTNFSEGRARNGGSRRRKWRDGYFVYTFWFARKADAALVKIMRMV